MKWPTVTVSLDQCRKAGKDLALFIRTIAMLSTGTIMFFVAFGVVGFIHSHFADPTPSSSMKGMAASVPSQFFMDMIGMEVPHLAEEGPSFTFSQTKVTGFLFSMLTDLNPHDPKTLVAREVPGMLQDRSVVLSKGMLGHADAPADYRPKGGVVGGDNPGETGGITANPQFPVPQGPQVPEPTAQPPVKTASKNVVFIYQSHNQESYLPELPGVSDPDKAYDPKTNVTMVGRRLAQAMEKEGIGAVHSDKNYPAIESGFQYAFSYKYSLKTLQEASAGHPDLKYYIDIHRDSQRREKTTAEINGQSYAQVYFVIGGKNPDWKQNYDLADQIHQALESHYPGLSKGVYAKADGNGVYNQSYSPNSLLIEVGGVDNTLEECYRTADALAVALAEVINNVEKVNAPAEAQQNEL